MNGSARGRASSTMSTKPTPGARSAAGPEINGFLNQDVSANHNNVVIKDKKKSNSITEDSHFLFN